MTQFKKRVPIFFSSDENYLPYLAVAVQSIKENASEDVFYDVYVLNDKFGEDFKSAADKLASENLKITFCDVSRAVNPYKRKLKKSLRDYYTASIFYRLFIASLFKDLDKAVYIDCDVVLVSDIAKLYDVDVSGYILGACADQVVSAQDAFKVYVENALGIKQSRYFNSGVLLINLSEYRKNRILEKFITLLNKYNFESVAPDQDYLNVLCKDKVLYLDAGFDRMPTADAVADYPIYLIHYNMFNKPWRYDDVLYGEYFWKYAKNTEFYDRLKTEKDLYPESAKIADAAACKLLLENSYRIAASEKTFKSVLENKAVKNAVSLPDYKFAFNQSAT